jgi:phosphotriesterase-related protein
VTDRPSGGVSATVEVVRTVRGDLPSAQLGRVDYHEHLFQVSPLLPGDELDDEGASTTEAELLAGSGFDAMVDATPLGLGRRPRALSAASARSGLHVVATTGAHRAEHYRDQDWVLALDEHELEQRFVQDVTTGMAEADRPGAAASPVRAGVLKAGLGYWQIGPFERRVLTAVAAAHRSTGAPVMVHLEHGTAAHEVLDLLADDGAPADRVALAHVDRNLDPGLHAELAARGALLGYDGPARARNAPDSAVLECLAAVVERGLGGQVLLGGDVARRSRYVAYGGMPGLAYLGTRFVPRLKERIGAAATDRILRDNPARWLTLAASHAPQN